MQGSVWTPLKHTGALKVTTKLGKLAWTGPYDKLPPVHYSVDLSLSQNASLYT